VNDAQQAPVRGRTRWRRFAIVLGAGLALSITVMVGVANGAIAANFAVSGSTFKVSADKLVGTGFVQYGGVVHKKDGTQIPVAVSGIGSVTEMDNLCQSVVVPGGISLVIRAGKSKPVTATDLLIDMTQLSGDASFGNISIGQDASTLDQAPNLPKGAVGGFGQQAETVTITNLQQVAWSTSAGSFNLNGLDLHVSLSGEQCFA
jgi:uncharacterized protein DUF6230